MKQKIKDMNFLPETIVQSVTSQAKIQEITTCNTNNEDSTGSEIQITSGNTVAIQVDLQVINTHINSIHSTNREVKIVSENEHVNKEDIHEILTYYINK